MTNGSGEVLLVTGAAGEVGHGLLEALAAADRPVVAVDRAPLSEEARSHCRASVIADVTDADAMSAVLDDHGITGVIHLAALLSGSGERNPSLAWEVNANATVALLEMVVRRGRDRGIRIPFVLPSSIAVYGAPSRAAKDAAGAIDEDTFLDPITIYGVTKLACEHAGRYHDRHHRLLDGPHPGGVDFRVIRYPGLISSETVPTGGTSDFGPLMVHRAGEGTPYACFVDEASRIPFMTMGEAVDATLRLLDAPREGLTRTAYHVSSFAPSAGAFAEAVRGHFQDAAITFEPDPMKQAIVDSWPADLDCTAAARDWGFVPKHDLASALADELVPAVRARVAPA